MIYVEALRVRRVLIVYAIVIAVLCALALAVVSFHATIEVNGEVHHTIAGSIPLSAIFAMAGLIAATAGSVLGTNLNKDNEHLVYVWTRPIERFRIALSYCAVDVIGLICVWVLGVMLLIVPTIAAAGADAIAVSPDAFLLALLGLGVAFLTYSLAQLSSAWYTGGGGRASGLSWPAFIVLLALGAASLPPFYAAIVAALNFLNPLAYLGTSGSHGDGPSLVALPLLGRIALAWALGVAEFALATYLWTRREA